MDTVEDIRDYFQWALANELYTVDKTGVLTIEHIGASFLATEPAIFGEPNDDYIQRELKWYESMSLNVNDIPAPVPTIWKQVADKDGFINSNYGWCIWHAENYHQYANVVHELRQNPNSRRAIMIYTRPNMWSDFNKNGRSDFMCTNAVQYMIRDDKLHSVIQMRSNDVVYGYRNDYAWQKYVLDKVAASLNVEAGDIVWQVGNLHVYERHFKLIDPEWER